MSTSQPGWYPDPSGAPGQRYFDGKDWTDQRGGPQTGIKPDKKRRKWPWIVAGVVAFLVIMGLLGDGDEEDQDTAAPATTTQAPAESTAEQDSAPPEEDTTQAPAESTAGQDSAPPEEDATSAPTEEEAPPGPESPEGVEFHTEGDIVNAEFSIDDHFTEGMIKGRARSDTIEILEYATATYPNASQVTVQGAYPMTDSYGNTSTDVVINLTYLRSTLDKINFDGVDREKIWELADSGYIAPAFRP